MEAAVGSCGRFASVGEEIVRGKKNEKFLVARQAVNLLLRGTIVNRT